MDTVLEVQNGKIGHASPHIIMGLLGQRQVGMTREQTLEALTLLLKCLTPEKLGDILNELAQLRLRVAQLEKEKANG